MKTRKPYAEAFKQEAIKLVTEQHMAPSQVAHDLGIGRDTLHRWLRAARSAAAPSTDTPAPELTRLRREVEQVRMERDILKKALGIFSRMPQ